MNIDQLMTQYLRYIGVVERKSQATVASYRNDLNKYAQFLARQEMQSIQQVGEHTVNFFIMEASGSKATINHLISVVCSFHRYCSMELGINNPTLKLHSFKKAQKLPLVFSQQQIEVLLEGIDGDDFLRRAIFELLYGSGLRISEVCNLEYNHVFLEQGFIKFMSKGDKQRMVPINKRTTAALLDYFTYERAAHPNKKLSYCFLSKRGAQLTRQAIHNMVKYETGKHDMNPHFSAHTFRHAFATHLIDGGADLRVVQELLGHENISTTQIYTHVQSKKLRTAYDMFHPRNKEIEDEEV
ncbi:MAG: tyrosine-type recombinase/integrase [Erysipelotrichaceae bacterium]